MIRNTLIWGVLVLLAVAIAAPALLGLYIAHDFASIVARFEQPGLTRVVASRFERGWFVSHALIRVKLAKTFCQDQDCPAVTLAARIDQGPIAFGAPRTPGAVLRPVIAVVVTRARLDSFGPGFSLQPAIAPLRLIAWLGLDGQTHMRWHLPAVHSDIVHGKPLAHLDSAAVTGRARWARHPMLFKTARLHSPALSIVGERSGHLGWHGLSAGLTHARGKASVWRLGARTLTFDNGNTLAAQLNRFQFDVHPRAGDHGLFRARFAAHVARLALGSVTHGRLSLQGQVRHIDPAAWRVLPARWAKLAGHGRVVLDDIALYRHVLPALLSGGVGLTIQQLRFASDAGTLTARAEIQAPKTLRPVTMGSELLAQLHGTFAVRVPTALIRPLIARVLEAQGRAPSDISRRMVTQSLRGLVGGGWLTRAAAGNAYRIRLRLSRGQVSLNGHAQIGWRAVINRLQAASRGL